MIDPREDDKDLLFAFLAVGSAVALGVCCCAFWTYAVSYLP